MKRLLLFITALSINFYMFSQTAPVNENVENATLINFDTSNNYFSNAYFENDIRLDLASNDTGGQGGCTFTPNPTIYYKFMANEDATIRATISDATNQSLGFTSLAFFTAPNLEVTSNSDLQSVSFCGQTSQETINVTQGQAYYVIFLRVNGGSNLTNIQFSKAPKNGDVQSAELIENFNFTDYNWLDMASPDTGGQVNCATTGFKTVYYKFTASTNGMLSITQNINASDGFIIAYNAPNLNATQNSDLSLYSNCAFGNSTLINLVQGDSYYIIVSSTQQSIYATIQFHFIPPAPSNDLIANALPVNNFTFEDNVNINGASGPEVFVGNCNVLTNPVVYYKFTAEQNMTLAATVFDASLNDPTVPSTLNPSGAVYIYTAPDENVTNESQLTPVGVCANDGLSGNVGAYSKTFEAILGTTYYVQARSATTGSPTKNTKVRIEMATPLSISEKNTLLDFYNDTTGVSWTYNNYWNSTEQVGTWFGVATHIINGQEHVTAISFTGNNLDGTLPSTIENLSQLKVFSLQANFAESFLTGGIPTEFGNLSELEVLYIRYHDLLGGSIPASLGNANKLRNVFLEENSLTGSIPQELTNLNDLVALRLIGNDLSGVVPDFSALQNFATLDTRLNYLDFSGIEPNHSSNLNINGYLFSPQRTQDEEQDIISPVEVDIDLDIIDGDNPAMNNQYQWYKDGNPISGANSSVYTIIDAQEVDSGVYHCEITNSVVIGLTIVRANINLIVDKDLSTDDFADNDFSLFPNPANNWISLKTKSVTDAVAQIFDATGKLVLKKQLTSNVTAIAIDQLSAGMYIVTITNKTIQSTKRFIKQ